MNHISYHVICISRGSVQKYKSALKLENMLKAKRDDVQNCRKNCTYLPIDVFRKVLEISILRSMLKKINLTLS